MLCSVGSCVLRLDLEKRVLAVDRGHLETFEGIKLLSSIVLKGDGDEMSSKIPHKGGFCLMRRFSLARLAYSLQQMQLIFLTPFRATAAERFSDAASPLVTPSRVRTTARVSAKTLRHAGDLL